MATYATADEWFESRSTAEFERDKSLTATYLFDIDGPTAGQYTLDVVEGETTWSRGATKKATCTIKAKEDNFLKLASGEMSAQKALLTRRVKIQGNMAQALALSKFAG